MISGFKATGLWPVSREILKSADFRRSEAFVQSTESVVEDSVNKEPNEQLALVNTAKQLPTERSPLSELQINVQISPKPYCSHHTTDVLTLTPQNGVGLTNENTPSSSQVPLFTIKYARSPIKLF